MREIEKSKMMMMLNLVWAWFGDDSDDGLCGFDFFVIFSNFGERQWWIWSLEIME